MPLWSAQSMPWFFCLSRWASLTALVGRRLEFLLCGLVPSSGKGKALKFHGVLGTPGIQWGTMSLVYVLTI